MFFSILCFTFHNVIEGIETAIALTDNGIATIRTPDGPADQKGTVTRKNDRRATIGATAARRHCGIFFSWEKKV